MNPDIGEFTKKRSPDYGKEYWGKSISCDPPQHHPSMSSIHPFISIKIIQIKSHFQESTITGHEIHFQTLSKKTDVYLFHMTEIFTFHL